MAGCPRVHYARGLCNTHYAAVRYAERDADPSVPRCEARGCARAVRARGFCGRHYQIALRDGRTGTPCVVPGCPSGSASRGLCRRHASRARRYGIAREDLARFDGDCEVCGRPADVVDHDHTTNAVRGALCDRCNHAIGHAQDSPELLRALADYLDHHNAKERTS